MGHTAGPCSGHDNVLNCKGGVLKIAEMGRGEGGFNRQVGLSNTGRGRLSNGERGLGGVGGRGGGVSVSNSVKEIGSDDRKAMMVEEQRVD